MRSHRPADDFEPAERTAIGAGIAGIDPRQPAAAEELDALQVGRVRDDDALCSISREDGIDFLVDAEVRLCRK